MAFDAGAIIGRITLQGAGEFETSMQRVGKAVQAVAEESRQVPSTLQEIQNEYRKLRERADAVQAGLDRLREASRQATQAKREIPPVLRDVERASQGVGRRILEMAAAFGIATTATQVLARAWASGRSEFTAGLRAIESLREEAISVAAVLTSMAQDPSPQTFARNLAYAEDIMRKLNIAAARFVATGQEMRLVFQAFALRGVLPVTPQDIDALGRITDAISAFTRGQPGQERQLFQEVAALLEGRVLPGMTRLSEFIQRNVGDLRAWIQQHREQGTLIQATAEQLKGFALAQGAVSGLLSTQLNTLRSIWDLVRQEGYLKPHRDLVNLLRQVNAALLDQQGNLTPLAREIANRINVEWENFTNSVRRTGKFFETEVLPTLRDIHQGVLTIKSLWDELPSEAKEAGLLGVLLLGLGWKRGVVLTAIAASLQALGEMRQQAEQSRRELGIDVVERARALGFQPPEFVPRRPGPGEAFSQEFALAELNRRFEERRRAAEEFLQRFERTAAERTMRSVLAELEQAHRGAGAAALAAPGLDPAAVEKIETGVRQLHERLQRLRGEAFEIELAQVRRQQEELLKLAGQDTERQLQIRRAAHALIVAMQAEHQRQLEETIRAAQSSAEIAALEATGRVWEARFLELQRRHELERQAVQHHEALLLATRKRHWAEFAQFTQQMYDNIKQQTEDAYRQITSIDRQLIDVRKEFFGATPSETLQQLEELKRTRHLDPQTLLQVNREILQLSRSQAQERAKALTEEAAQLRARAEQLRQAFDPLRADLALRGALQRESAARSLLAEAEALGKTLGTEIENALQEQRQSVVSQLERINASLETLNKQFEAYVDMFRTVARDGVSMPERPASPTIPPLLRGPEGIGAIVRPEGGGLGIIRANNVTINIDLPSWITDPQQAMQFIRDTVANMIAETRRRTPTGAGSFP